MWEGGRWQLILALLVSALLAGPSVAGVTHEDGATPPAPGATTAFAGCVAEAGAHVASELDPVRGELVQRPEEPYCEDQWEATEP